MHCIANDPAAAVTNMEILRYLVKNNDYGNLVIHVHDSYYLDLSSGPLEIDVGPRSTVSDLWILGPGTFHGINATQPNTPLLRIRCEPETYPHLALERLTLTSDGSVLHLVNAGNLSRLVDISINGWAGAGDIDHDGWSDAETASYGLRVDDARQLHVRDMAISHGTGHGLLVNGWHAGEFTGVCSHNCGAGLKLQRCHGVRIDACSKSNWGYGLQARDCGCSRQSRGRVVCGAGGPSVWNLYAARNGRRGPSPLNEPYRYSQVHLTNCGRLTLRGHTGARCNQIRGDQPSIDACVTDESVVPPLSLYEFNTTDIRPPEPTSSNTNWHQVWENDRFRPRWDGKTIKWPARSFNNTVSSQAAYWRLFPALQGPARFVFRIVVEDQTGAIAEYCTRREQLTPRQAPVACGISIDPVGGASTPFPLWSREPVTLTGELTVTDKRDDINLSINAWLPGMEDRNNMLDAEQTHEHVMKIHEVTLWRLPLDGSD